MVFKLTFDWPTYLLTRLHYPFLVALKYFPHATLSFLDDCLFFWTCSHSPNMRQLLLLALFSAIIFLMSSNKRLYTVKSGTSINLVWVFDKQVLNFTFFALNALYMMLWEAAVLALIYSCIHCFSLSGFYLWQVLSSMLRGVWHCFKFFFEKKMIFFFILN